MAQIFPIDFEEKLTMAQDDYILFSDSEDGNKIKKAQYKNLKGEKGDTGARINSASFSGDDIVFGETDGSSVTLPNAVNTLTGPQGEEGPTGPTGNGIASITSSKVGKTTTVTITETNTNVDTFQIEDGADGQGDVNGPASSIDGDLAMFDGATGKLIKDGGALTTKVFTLANTSDTTNAQAAYDWYKAGKMAVILYSGNYYFFKGTGANSVYFAVNEYTPLDNTNVTSLVQKTLTLGLSGTTVTSISSWNMSMTGYNVLATDVDYSTPYTPAYNGSPATKKYVDDKIISSSTAPSSPTEGMVWYDTTNDQLKVYDGANWNVTGKEYTDGNGINIDANNEISNTGVLSVNGQTGNITIETFQLAPNSPLNPKYRRYGTQAQYEALAQYYTDEPGDTVYFTI